MPAIGHDIGAAAAVANLDGSSGLRTEDAKQAAMHIGCERHSRCEQVHQPRIVRPCDADRCAGAGPQRADESTVAARIRWVRRCCKQGSG